MERFIKTSSWRYTVTPTLVVVLASMSTCLCGCAQPKLPAITAALARELADREFPHARFYKPRDGTENGIETILAPLIVQEFVDDAELWVALVDPSARADDVRVPMVYWVQSSTTIKGSLYKQVTYVWWYARRGSGGSTGDLVPRGVRMTLGSDGGPLVWEALTTEPGPTVVFVAEALENEAKTRLGGPLPGRRFAIERVEEESRGVIVARVIADGPIPMGPYAYVTDNELTISTILCRCMPAQVDEFVESVYYDLMPLIPLGEVSNPTDRTMAKLLGALPASKLADQMRWPFDIPR